MANRKEKNKMQKKFPLGCDADKEEIFSYPYLHDDSTIQFMKDHGRIMIIIRGPNSTLKATLSEMILERYPEGQHCCADHYFSKTFSPPERTKETLKYSHEYCEKKVETACQKNISPIIVQNTHIRKRELQIYLDFAAMYNYTVVMAITLYKFDVTPEALERINPDGLNVKYFRIRLNQWEDIPPLFTGWFLCPQDVLFVLKSLQTVLSVLLSDAKFCQAFNSYDNDDIWDYFNGRRNIYCIAGYSYNRYLMAKYYLSDEVQESYGKSYYLSIYGYLITINGVFGIVSIDKEMSGLLLKADCNDEDRFCHQLSSLAVHDNVTEYKAMISLNNQDTVSAKTAILENTLDDDDDIDFKNCKLIHIAQRKFEQFDIRAIDRKYFKTLDSLTNNLHFNEFEDKIKIHSYRLPDNEWFVRLPQIIKVKTLFTGIYV